MGTDASILIHEVLIAMRMDSAKEEEGKGKIEILQELFIYIPHYLK
jgi:hypothetical protein